MVGMVKEEPRSNFLLVKCEKCKKKINTTFLNKLVGTVVKDKKGKRHYICNECQRKYKDKLSTTR